MALQEGVVPRRRNGRQQACEPCRKRKLACDHSYPTCQRCKRRKIPIANCVYLASPVAQQSTAPESTTLSGLLSFPTDNFVSDTRRKEPRDPQSSLLTPVPTPLSLFVGPSTFLGPTSFSAVFAEHRTDLELPQASSSSHENGSAEAREESEASSIRFGSKILAQIPDEPSCIELFSRHVNPNDGWVRLAGKQLVQSLWRTFGPTLSGRSDADLYSLSRLICKNTAGTLPEQESSSEWISTFSGDNLRWEALGILFTYWAFSAISSSEEDPMFHADSGLRKCRRQVVTELKASALSCINMCSQLNCANSLVVYLLYKNSLLESQISGDASLIYWRLHADLIAVTTSIGLHRDADCSSYPTKASAFSESRRRIFAAVYNIDKVISSFSGRPPLLSHRHSSTPLPLDLSDEDLLSDQGSLSKAASSLDARGWNADGRLRSTTILRARTMFATVREEILDMALAASDSSYAKITQQVMHLKERSALVSAQLPSVIIYRPADLSDMTVTGPILYAKLLTRIENLQNLFILERLLIKNSEASGQELLDISRELLDLSLVWWKQRDRLIGLHGDFEWLIMQYAVPAAGILCIELLKPKHNHHRSSTIQNLSLFISFLDWVKPSAPNAELCYRVREIVARVLDRVLNSPPPPLGTATGTIETESFEFPTDFDFDLEFTNMDLLNGFDWVSQEWSG